jgi:RNA-directed DNA polymerase
MKEQNLSIDKSELFDLLCTKVTLNNAFKAVKKNKGAAGVDGITINDFEANLEEEIDSIKRELVSWTYQPKPVKRVEIPKSNGGTRPLGIPCIKDRVVQTAIKMLLEPIFEPLFSEHSYGFRPNRNQHKAIAAAQEIVKKGKEFVVDIDLSKFFDTINHDKLINRLSREISDKRIIRIIGLTLRSGIMNNGTVEPSKEGSVQGSPLSPLLSNIVLDELDKELENRGLEFCRYADDCNIFVKTRLAAERVMQSTTKFIENKLKLKINKEKSKVARSKYVNFLGITIIAMTVAISTASMSKAMAKVKELTPRGTSQTLEQAIKRVNRWYLGWSAYYGMTQYPSQLARIEAHIRRRFRARIVRQQKTKRNLFNKLVKRGTPKKRAGIVFVNIRTWDLSHTRAVQEAYTNRWFIEDMNLKIRSNENRPEWFHVRKLIKLT